MNACRFASSLVAALIMISHVPLALADGPTGGALDLFSNGDWGNRGAYHVQAARALTPLSLGMIVNQGYNATSTLLAPGDKDVQSELKLAIIGSPWDGLEIGINMTSLVNKYTDITEDSFQLQGNPSLLLKYSLPAFLEGLGLGGVLTFMLPTSTGGAGLNASALQLNAMGTASYRAHRFVDVSANIGYVFDNSGALYPNQTGSPVQRYAYAINDKQHRMNWGVAGVGEFNVADVLGLSPFVELWGEYASGVPASANPVAVSFGVKAFPWMARVVDGIIGADFRLGGEPHAGSALSGLAPWQLLLQLGLHFGEAQVVRTDALVLCSAETQCADGTACEGGGCVHVKDVEIEKVVEQEVVKEVEHVRIAGSVVDAESGQPIGGAEVSVPGLELPVTVNNTSGKFTLCQMPANGNTVTLTARALGYIDDDEAVVCAKDAGPVAFQLQSTGKPVTGTLKVTVRDDDSEEPIVGAELFVPSLNQKLPMQPDGSFEATLKVGRYQVLVSKDDYETQRQDVQITSEETTALDVRLQTKGESEAVRSLKIKKRKKPPQ